jgi:hypothetical protein
MATKEKDRDERLHGEQGMAAWHACLALESATQPDGPGMNVQKLMEAAFNAGKAVAFYRARNI